MTMTFQILHAFVLTHLPKLQHLNISSNNIHTISQQALYLPKLVSLDLGHNNLQELPQDLVQSLDSLRQNDRVQNTLLISKLRVSCKKSKLSSVQVYSRVQWASNFLQGTREHGHVELVTLHFKHLRNYYL